MKVFLVLSLAACGLLFIGCSPEGTESKENLARFIVAMEPDKDPDAMLEDRRALQAYLGGALDHAVEAIVPMSSAVIHEGLQNGSIDVAYLSATAAARLVENGTVALLLAELIDGQPSYQSYWIALKEAPYRSIADLRGKPIAFSSRTSTSGFIIPVWDLYKQNLIDLEAGPSGFFGEGNVHFGVGYVSAAERVLDGSVEAAAVSDYVLDQDKHLSAEQRGRLRVVDSQGPVPSHVLVVRRDLPPVESERLQAAFLAMNEDAVALRDRIFGAPLVPIATEAHLEVIREALELTRDMSF